MPIDASIPLSVQQFRFPDIAGMAAQKQNMMLQRQQADQSAEMNAFNMDRAKASDTREQSQFDQQKAMSDLGMMVKIGDWIERQPDKAAAYPQAIAVARKAGLDTSTLPQQYDPAWVSEEMSLARAILEKPQEMTTVMQNVAAMGFQPGSPEFRAEMARQLDTSKILQPQPGEGAFQLMPDGNVRTLIHPNEGGMPAGAPVERPVDVSGIPTAAISYLVTHPEAWREFDEMYGTGAARAAMQPSK